jgi:uncharacterized protein YndB with AHSA1/START domain
MWWNFASMSELYAVERAYPVSIERLWSAWTDAAELAQWYCPTNLKVVPGTVVSDSHEGGWWTVAVDASEFGFIAYFYGTYSEVIQEKKLVHTMNYTQSEEVFLARTSEATPHVIQIEFRALENGSWVRFSQHGDMAEFGEDQALEAKAGMESYFDNLGLYLAKN